MKNTKHTDNNERYSIELNGLSIEDLDKLIKDAQKELKEKAKTLNLIPKAPEVYIHCLLDNSGSMGIIVNDTIGGFNSFLKEQQESKDGKAYISLHFFNDQYRTIWDRLPIEEAKNITDKDYRPSSNTALLDAMGKMLSKILSDNKDNNIILIMTDGEENSSKEYTPDTIKHLTKRCEDKGYKFIYLGANQDSFRVGRSLGIYKGLMANFSATAKGVSSAYDTMRSSTTSYRASVSSATGNSTGGDTL